jgi:hypothetical protein
MQRFIFILLLIGYLLSTPLSAQLRLTIDGGISIGSFDQKPVLPASILSAFGLNNSFTEKIAPLGSNYVGLGMAHYPSGKVWGWSARLQYTQRGYRYVIESASSSRDTRSHSYTSFIDGMAQLTRTVAGKLRINAGPYFSLAVRDNKYPGLNLNGPDYSPSTPVDYGFNAGISYPFERLSITVNYQRSLLRYSFAALDTAFNNANGSSNAVVIAETPRIGAIRLGLEFAIWE